MATLASATIDAGELGLHRRLLPALDDHLGDSRSILLCGPRVPGNTKTDLTLWVGRLHYSLSSTLSAHFRWSLGASERLNVAS